MKTLADRLYAEDCILLYSFTMTVIESLRNLLKVLKFKPKFLIAECRNKCLTPFSDAIAYANKLSEFGFDMSTVRFISDVSIGYL